MSWIFHFIGLLISFSFIDLSSSSLFAAIICPMFFAAFLISFLYKLSCSSESSGYLDDAKAEVSSSFFDSWSSGDNSSSGGDGGGD